jgi:hypothetical protein
VKVTLGPNARLDPPRLSELVPSLQAACEKWQQFPTFDNGEELFALCGVVMWAQCCEFALVKGEWDALGETVEAAHD